MKGYMKALIKKRLVHKRVLEDKNSAYNIIRQSVKFYDLAFFFIRAHYQYNVSLDDIMVVNNMYTTLRINIILRLIFTILNQVSFLNLLVF